MQLLYSTEHVLSTDYCRSTACDSIVKMQKYTHDASDPKTPPLSPTNIVRVPCDYYRSASGSFYTLLCALRHA